MNDENNINIENLTTCCAKGTLQQAYHGRLDTSSTGWLYKKHPFKLLVCSIFLR